MFDSEELTGRIVEWFETGKGRPFVLELRPTNRCNLRCPSCVARGGPGEQAQGEELSEDEYLRIIDEAAELGVRYVHISGGGEPFMYGDKLLRLMWRIKHNRMKGWVISNGTLFTEEIIKQIVKMGWDTVLLSLDAPQAELNDLLRNKPGSFDRIVASMRQFSAMKEKYGCDVPHVNVATVLSHYNCGVIAEMVKLCAGLDIEKIAFQTVHVRQDLGGENFLLTGEDIALLADEFPTARKLADELGVRNNLHELDREMLEGSSELPKVIQSYSSEFKGHPILSIHCFSPWFYIGINADGTIGPCSIDHPTTYKGDIRTSSLKEYWQNPHFQGFREGLMKGELPKACVNCCGTNVIEIRKLRKRLQKEFFARNQNGN